MKLPAGSYVERRGTQRSYVDEPRLRRFYAHACPECLAPVGKDCMDAHNQHPSKGRYPVRPHKARRALLIGLDPAPPLATNEGPSIAVRDPSPRRSEDTQPPQRPCSRTCA